VIRNVVLGRVADSVAGKSPDQVRRQLEEGLAGIAGLRLPGQLAMAVGRDAGLRAGGWTFAITNDWADADAYLHYDKDDEHNRYRAMLGEICAAVARVQFELPG
jgi:hypothetical protein